MGFLDAYMNSVPFCIYEIEKIEHGLTARYFHDHYSSVWISQESNFNAFAQNFRVISGGWYGSKSGGRWKTSKRTHGEICFEGVTVTEERAESQKTEFLTTKPRFTCRLNVKFSSQEVGTWQFKCDNVITKSWNRIELFNIERNEYVDMTDSLAECGMKLIE